METTQGKIVASAVSPAKYKEGVDQVELRQEFTRQYNGIQTTSSMKDSLFSASDLGMEGKSYTEKRVAWDYCPKGFTAEEYQKLIDKHTSARLYKTLSHSPILDDTQAGVMRNGLSGDSFASFNADNGLEGDWSDAHRQILLGKIAERQVVRYGENADGNDSQDAVLYNGKVQYRIINLSLTGQVDIDERIQKAVTESIDLAPNTVAAPVTAK